jgi:hypothetical protein
LLAAHEIVGGPGVPLTNRLCAELAQTRASGSNGLSFLLVHLSRTIQPVVDNSQCLANTFRDEREIGLWDAARYAGNQG